MLLDVVFVLHAHYLVAPEMIDSHEDFRWLHCEVESAGSFLWVCRCLGRDPGVTRRKILSNLTLAIGDLNVETESEEVGDASDGEID